MERLYTSYIVKTDKLKHLLEWPESKMLIAPNAEEDVEQQEWSFVAYMGMKK